MKSGKCCFFPKCKNTDSNCEKMFFQVPRSDKRRKEWFKIARCRKKNCNSCLYCCEDHFDHKNDFVNFGTHRRLGAKLLLKKTAVPRQKIDSSSSSSKTRNKRTSTTKNSSQGKDPDHFCFVNVDTALNLEPDDFGNHSEEVRDVLTINRNESVDDFTPKVEFEHCALPEIKSEPRSELGSEPDELNQMDSCDTGNSRKDDIIQVNPMDGIVGTNILMQIQLQQPIVVGPIIGQIMPQKQTLRSRLKTRPVVVSKHISVNDVINFDDPYKHAVSKFDKTQRQISTLQIIQMSSNYYLGIPVNMMYILKSISDSEKIFPMDLLITLNKIRLNDPLIRLSLDYGLNVSQLRDIFKHTIPKLAKCLKKFIYWPKLQTPATSFNSRKVRNMIDIIKIEAEIAKKTDSYLATPDYYTVKFLVCTSEEGIINFLSPVFPKELTDIEVVAYSELFMSEIPKNVEFFAPEDFKLRREETLEGRRLLTKYMSQYPAENRDVVDVVYDKFESNVTLLDDDTDKKSKMRNIIDRIRQFGVFKKHTQVSSEFEPFLNDIITIVCALINIQECNIDVM